MDEQAVIQLLETGEENEFVDFKEKYYSPEKRGDLIKDICAFANSPCEEDQFIIFGVRNDTLSVCGIQEPLEDISCINQLLNENVEPFIHVSNGTVDYKGHRLGYLKIFDNIDKPYVLKKDYISHSKRSGILKRGDIYIRKGATIFRAIRRDLDFIYTHRRKKEIQFYDNLLTVEEVYFKHQLEYEYGTVGIVRLKFLNESDMAISLKSGRIIIYNQFNTIERKIINPVKLSSLGETPYKIEAKSAEVINFYFEFTSGDCIQLNVDEDGRIQVKTWADISFLDLQDEEYICNAKEVLFYAKGDILHKVKLKYRYFREFLTNNQNKLMQSIAQGDEEAVSMILKKGCPYFELVQLLPNNPFCFFDHPEFPEYRITYNMIECALLNGSKTILSLLTEYHLSLEFIEYSVDRILNGNETKI